MSKRRPSDAPESSPGATPEPQKKRKTDDNSTVPNRPTNSLTTWLSLPPPPPPPSPIFSSDPLTDRDSYFIAWAAEARTKKESERFREWVKNEMIGIRTHLTRKGKEKVSGGEQNNKQEDSEIDDPFPLLLPTPHQFLIPSLPPGVPAHNVLAYRFLEPRRGYDGSESAEAEAWEIIEGWDDDGEKGGGREILKGWKGEEAKGGGSDEASIAIGGEVDIAVVVSRWFGGTLLGPARFSHIRQVAIQALRRLAYHNELISLVSQLQELDNSIDAAAVATISNADQKTNPNGGGPSAAKTTASTKYPLVGEGRLTIEKGRRLVTARQKRLQLLEKKKNEKMGDQSL